jgi:hypothetical protein
MQKLLNVCLRFNAVIATTAVLICGAAIAQDMATVNRDTQLRTSAGGDAAILAPLTKNTEIEVVERQGSYTRVKAQGKVGFIPVFHFTAKSTAAIGTATSGGSAQSTRTSSATVGARGVSKQADLERVVPNPSEFQRYQALKVDKSVGQSHATRSRLLASANVPILDEKLQVTQAGKILGTGGQK